MRMERLCLIMFSICVSSVLGHDGAAEKILFVHSPPKLYLKPGENATFTCNISALDYTPGNINWYKNQKEKIAEVNHYKNNRLRIVTNWTLWEAKLHIVNVTFNDSGEYYCGLLNVSVSDQVIVSEASVLIVKNFSSAVAAPTTNADLPESKPNSLTISIISYSVILTLVLLLAIGSAIILIWYKQRNNIPQPQQQDLEKPPQDPSVYTVNYGILEFGASQPYRKSAELRVSEQVEYATIMFPQQTPSMGEKRGRSA